MVEGLSRTHEEVVRSALAVEEASLLDPEAMAQSQRNLAKLGIFRNVSIRTSAPEVLEESKDVYVVVEERNTQSYSLGGGYSFADGPRAFFEYSKINLFGEVLQFQARAKVNYLDWNYDVLTHPKNRRDSLDALGRRINLSLQYPRFLSLLPTEIGAHLDLVHEQLSRAGAYDFQRSAAILGTDLMGQHGFSASLQYELETDRIGIDKTATEAQLSASDVARLRFDEGTINLHSIRSILSFDRRDDPTDPHRGFQVNVSGEVAQSLGGSVKAPSGANERPFALFAKASAQASAYLPLWRSVVLALSLKGGKIFPLDDRSRTPGPRRFFLGGASSIRGFPEDGLVPADVRETLDEEVRECNSAPDECISESAKRLREGKPYNSLGGELFALGRAELRVPIRRQIETALFIDVGNLWLDQTKVQLLKLRYSAGVGIRVITPIGPAAIDLGFNLAPDALINESTFEPHFSIGLF
jgi:outer membrane protein assembly factor BamA